MNTAAWVLLALACGSALIPFLGFASWLLAGPLLFTTFILAIIVLSRGGTLPGILLLLMTIFAAPLFIFVVPFVSSLVGAAGLAAATSKDRPTGIRAAAPAVEPTVAPAIGFIPPEGPRRPDLPAATFPAPGARPGIPEPANVPVAGRVLPATPVTPAPATPVIAAPSYAPPAPRPPEKTWERPHLYLQLASNAQRGAALEVKKRLLKAGYVVSGIEAVPGNPGIPGGASQLRYFTPADAGEARRLSAELAPFFGPAGGIEADLPPDMPHVSHARQYEVWFSSALH